MAGGDPLQSWVVRKESLIKDNLFVFPAEFAKARLQSFTDRPKRSRNPSHTINVPVLMGLFRVNVGDGRGVKKEVFNDFGNESAFLGFRRLAHYRRKIQFALSQSFEGRVRNLAKA